jgi:hypothetical protein
MKTVLFVPGYQEGIDSRDYRKTIQAIPSKTIYFYGETELKSWPNISYRHKAISSLPVVSEVFIPEATHDVTSDVYTKAIQKELEKV